MKQLIGIAVILFVLGAVGGCKKDDETGPTPTPIAPGTSNEVEPNDQTAQALGALGTTDVTVNGSASSVDDVDKYTITVGSTTNLHADVTWTGAGDLGVGIMSPTGIMITFRNTGASPRGCTLAGLPAGTYVLYVNANGATGYPQTYSLKIGPR